MSIIHNGSIEEISDNIVADKWKLNCVWEKGIAPKPGYCLFNNSDKAIELLNKHIKSNSRIVLHTDVDMDGVGTTYILLKFLKYMGITYMPLIINKEKVHGIQSRQIEYLNAANVADLVIITDSSTNMLNDIKKIKCDVLVIDHHDVDDENEDTFGKCNDGEHNFVVVNNTIENSDYDTSIFSIGKYNKEAVEKLDRFSGDKDMSCGLVVYELLRLYCLCFANEMILENLRLYQWVGVTLLTDVIDTLNERNQWYMDKTFFNNEIEKTLGITLDKLCRFKKTFGKSYVQYTLAPLVNKAIRAGGSAEALDTIINNLVNINNLSRFGELQSEAIEKVLFVKHTDTNGIETLSKINFRENTVALDISKYGISPNYTGVIASRICGDYNKSAAVYLVGENGLCEGSFRGKCKDIDYRKYFENFDSSVFAQGHSTSFGIKVTPEQLKQIMLGIEELEKNTDNKPYITAGNMNIYEYGVYHINDILEFKRQGFLWKIAIGNSKVASTDEINIRIKASDIALKTIVGKVYIYDVFGISCKAFSPIRSEYVDIYIEYDNEIVAYAREVK